LPDENYLVATKINLQGQVVGQATTPVNKSTAFLWTPDKANGTTGTMANLGVLDGGYTGSIARSINSFGQVAGDSDGPSAIEHSGFLWTPDRPNGTEGSMSNLGDLRRGQPFSLAWQSIRKGK
jgi:probable HAF family extracellular repeat protein